VEVAVAKILVVDDEPDVRMILRRILERAGHEVADAGDGAAALEYVRRAGPDLVVTDNAMPVMGGVALVRALRADPATARIPVLAATAVPGELVDLADAVLLPIYGRDDVVRAVNALLAPGTSGSLGS